MEEKNLHTDFQKTFTNLLMRLASGSLEDGVPEKSEPQTRESTIKIIGALKKKRKLRETIKSTLKSQFPNREKIVQKAYCL